MSLISYNGLLSLIDAGVITRVAEGAVNSASIDIRLGEFVLTEHCEISPESRALSIRRVVLRNKEGLATRSHSLIKDGPFILFPGEFCLAQSEEMFNLPNSISAEYKLKSSMARVGLEHLNAGWCDAGWHGSVLTLELVNLTRGHEIVLQHLDPIGQIVFFKHEPVPEDKSYAVRGRYNNDKTVQGVKLDPTRSIHFGDEEEEAMAAEYPVSVSFIPPTKKNPAQLIISDDPEDEGPAAM
jgi:deoxycytidine triphosphate deaminase